MSQILNSFEPFESNLDLINYQADDQSEYDNIAREMTRVIGFQEELVKTEEEKVSNNKSNNQSFVEMNPQIWDNTDDRRDDSLVFITNFEKIKRKNKKNKFEKKIEVSEKNEDSDKNNSFVDEIASNNPGSSSNRSSDGSSSNSNCSRNSRTPSMFEYNCNSPTSTATRSSNSNSHKGSINSSDNSKNSKTAKESLKFDAKCNRKLNSAFGLNLNSQAYTHNATNANNGNFHNDKNYTNSNYHNQSNSLSQSNNYKYLNLNNINNKIFSHLQKNNTNSNNISNTNNQINATSNETIYNYPYDYCYLQSAQNLFNQNYPPNKYNQYQNFTPSPNTSPNLSNNTFNKSINNTQTSNKFSSKNPFEFLHTAEVISGKPGRGQLDGEANRINRENVSNLIKIYLKFNDIFTII